MATPTMAIQRIRRARRKEAPPPSTSFQKHKQEYTKILTETRTLGGDPAINAVTDWILDRTHDTGKLPHPDAVRNHAKNVCAEQGIAVPDDSTLTR